MKTTSLVPGPSTPVDTSRSGRSRSAAATRARSQPLVEGPVEHVELLLAREAHEVDGVAGHADRELRVAFRVLHRVAQRLAIEHVDVHVVAAGGGEAVQHA